MTKNETKEDSPSTQTTDNHKKKSTTKVRKKPVKQRIDVKTEINTESDDCDLGLDLDSNDSELVGHHYQTRETNFTEDDSMDSTADLPKDRVPLR